MHSGKVVGILAWAVLTSAISLAAEKEAPPVPDMNPLHPAAGAFLSEDYSSYEEAGAAAYEDKRYEDAAAYYLGYLRGNVTDTNVLYNLACCYGLLGEADLAATYLKYSVAAGYDDVEWVKGDPDFDTVREAEVFRAVVADMEKKAAAAEGPDLFVPATAVFPSYVKIPADFDPKKTYSLVVALHGYGGNATTFGVIWDRLADRQLILAIPETPYAMPGGTPLGYSWNPGLGDEQPEIDKIAAEGLAAYIAAVVTALRGQYNIGDVYLLGFSQGGALAYALGVAQPQLYKGIIVFGGPYEAEMLAPEALAAGRGLRVFIAHGNDDRVVPPDCSRDAAALFKAAGYDVTYVTFAGGHTVDAETLKQAEKWMVTP